MPGVPWRTCLREVLFVDSEFPPACDIGGTFLRDGEAYRFLLETVCGLRSPMVGETQVLGQFRSFLAGMPSTDAPWLDTVARQLMADARVIRDRHLRGLGSRSYGSAVRRHLDGAQRIALLGAGALAEELLPYLSENRAVQQWTRQDIAHAEERPVSDGATVLVIAAPAAADRIRAVVRCYPALTRVIDLRGIEERDALGLDVPVITLDDLFAEVSAATAGVQHRVAMARDEIGRMAAAFERRHQLRPFGWDDLCA